MNKIRMEYGVSIAGGLNQAPWSPKKGFGMGFQLAADKPARWTCTSAPSCLFSPNTAMVDQGRSEGQEDKK